YLELLQNFGVYEAQRFDLRFFRPLRADLSIKKSSSFFPPLIAATSQLGLAPRPAQVSPDGPRYFGGTFLPFKTLPTPPRPTTAIAPPITFNPHSPDDALSNGALHADSDIGISTLFWIERGGDGKPGG